MIKENISSDKKKQIIDGISDIKRYFENRTNTILFATEFVDLINDVVDLINNLMLDIVDLTDEKVKLQRALKDTEYDLRLAKRDNLILKEEIKALKAKKENNMNIEIHDLTIKLDNKKLEKLKEEIIKNVKKICKRS